MMSGSTRIYVRSLETKHTRLIVCDCYCVVLSVYFVGPTPQDSTKVKYGRRGRSAMGG